MVKVFYDFYILLYFIASFFIILLYKKLKAASYTIGDLKIKNENLSKKYDEVACFNHDFNNILTIIGGYVGSRDMEGLVKYYNYVENECEHIKTLKSLSPDIINNPSVYHLITQKHKEFEAADINVSYELLLDLSELKMNVFEFTRILGILLDNAREAAKDTDEKIVNIYFRNEQNNNRQVIIVENSFKDKSIDINSIFEKNATSKESHSGLGLYEVRKILKKSKNLNLYTSINNNLFKQQLEIYY